MRDNQARSFVLVHGDNGSVVIGASAISPVRVLTDHPGTFPETLVLEDGSIVPLVMLDAEALDMLMGDGPQPEQSPAARAMPQAPAIDPELMDEARRLLGQKHAPWTGDVPSTADFLPGADGVGQELQKAADRMNALARQATDAVSRGQEQWSLLMEQLSVLKRNYSSLMDERDQLQKIVDSLSE